MRTFSIIWAGQMVSTIGSHMTFFALGIWAWELTGSATALAFINFFSVVPSILVGLIAGIIVDRSNRKLLMMLGDSVAAILTVGLLLMVLLNNLRLWHLYLMVAITSPFEEIQSLAYETSIATIVPKQHYNRAVSMGSMLHYGSQIFAPALAGVLYSLIGITGIMLIDLVTFGGAIATLLFVPISQPQRPFHQDSQPFWQELVFGFRYIWTRPGLSALVIADTLFWFSHDLGSAVYKPLILARTGGSATALGSVSSAAGIGGVTGAVVVSILGGTKRRLRGLLWGMIGAGISKTVFGMGQALWVWVFAQFCSSLNFPLMASSKQGIWLTKVAPSVLGRVLAASFFD